MASIFVHSNENLSKAASPSESKTRDNSLESPSTPEIADCATKATTTIIEANASTSTLSEAVIRLHFPNCFSFIIYFQMFLNIYLLFELDMAAENAFGIPFYYKSTIIGLVLSYCGLISVLIAKGIKSLKCINVSICILGLYIGLFLSRSLYLYFHLLGIRAQYAPNIDKWQLFWIDVMVDWIYFVAVPVIVLLGAIKMKRQLQSFYFELIDTPNVEGKLDEIVVV